MPYCNDASRLRENLITTRNRSDSLRESNLKHMPEQPHSLFGQYSILDVATSLFVSSLWLPNIASPTKHTYLTAIFASADPKLFSRENRIKSYEDFRQLCENLYGAVPDFSGMEDFVPEIDWGDIKFHHRERNYRIFYGCEIENIYDFLELFVVLHSGHDKEYASIVGRSPMDELENCLRLQDHIITSLKTQPDPDSIDISPGHIEIPSEEFWEEASGFYSSFNPEGSLKKFAEKMSVDWGDLPEELLRQGKFEQAAYTGDLLPCMFLHAGVRFYPILPRRFSHVLFNQWGSIIRKFYDSLDEKSSCSARIHEELYGFILKRFGKKDCFPFVRALTTEGKPHEVLFPFAFPSRDKIILVYITPPMINPQAVTDHMKEAAPKINEAISLISSEPNRLALTLKGEILEYKKQIKPELLVLIPLVSIEMVAIGLPLTFTGGKLASLNQFLAMVDEINDRNDLAGFFNFLDEIEKVAVNPFISLMDKYAEYKYSLGVPIEGAVEPDFIILDPHGGSYYRFRSLKKFWEEYPDIDFATHPRSWKVTHETDSRIVLESRSSHEKIICSRVEDTDVSIVAPFFELTHNEALIAIALMQCAEYYLQLYEEPKEHRFFRTHARLHIIFFPHSLITRGEFRHLTG